MVDKKITPEEWETSIKTDITEYMDSFLSIAKSCNMGTIYFHPVKTKYEDHEDFDQSKIDGVELRIVVEFIEPINKDKLKFI